MYHTLALGLGQVTYGTSLCLTFLIYNVDDESICFARKTVNGV